MFQHFVITRFNVRQHFTHTKYGKTLDRPEWLQHRIRAFDSICVPSMLGQDADFTWVVLFQEGTPERLLDRYRNKDERLIVRVCHEGMRWLPEVSGSDWLITTRIDADDAFHLNAMRRVQEAFRRKKEVLDFPNGISAALGSIQFHQRHFNVGESHFLSLVEPMTDTPRTAYATGHHDMARMFRHRKICGDRMWVEGIHDENLSNKFDGGPLQIADADLRRRFGFGYEELRSV